MPIGCSAARCAKVKAITEQKHPEPRRRAEACPLWRRLAWFVALWFAGVAAVGMVALLLRWLLKPAGA